MINDHDGHAVYKGDPLIGTTITTSDLSDLTSTIAESATGGWYISLRPGGEKVLTSGVFLGPAFVVSSYFPESNAIDRCTNVIGSARRYALGINDADGLYPVVFNGTSTGDPFTDRYDSRPMAGFSDPNLVIGGGNVYFQEGTDVTDTSIKVSGFAKTRWFQVFSETVLMQILQDSSL